VQFFCYHRDRRDSRTLRDQLLEDHWSYMDRYAAGMIARGPTSDTEGRLTGSVHIVDVPGPEEARRFAFEEPGYQAGAYRDLLLRRWDNLLGRTMWDFPDGSIDDRGFLVLAHGPQAEGPLPMVPEEDRNLVAFGPLLSDDARAWVGTAALLRADDRGGASVVLGEVEYAEVEVHHWRPGGRR